MLCEFKQLVIHHQQPAIYYIREQKKNKKFNYEYRVILEP